MQFLGNLIWFIFGGLISFVIWLLIGMIYCLTIIGIPFGIQAIKIGSVSLSPFGKSVDYGEIGIGSVIGNLIWIFFGGIELFLWHIFLVVLFGITIIGIPFAKQHYKLAVLSLIPFGARIH